jgi:hypothetical protein
LAMCGYSDRSEDWHIRIESDLGGGSPAQSTCSVCGVNERLEDSASA